MTTAPGPPRASVIMAVHDDAEYVAAAITSVLEQTYPDLELIVVDDGSTDDSADIVEGIGDPRLKMLRQENRGLTRSLNRALGQARGELVARQDADDLSARTRLERQVAFLDAHPACAAVGCAMHLVDEDGERVSTTRFPCDPQTIAATLPVSNQFCHGSLLARREVLVAAGGYREAFAYAQDYDLLLRLSERHALANLPEALYCYRVSGAQISTRSRPEQLAYAGLARRLARERREHGRDSLELGHDVAALLDPVTPDRRTDPARQLALYYLQAGKSAKARRQLVRLLRGGYVEPMLLAALAATFLGDTAVHRLSAWMRTLAAGHREA